MQPLPLLTTARALCHALETGDQSAADSLLTALNEPRSRGLLRQIAELTREVHESFSGVVSDPKLVEITQHAMPDARERLHYVIVKTEESAHRTLAAVEEMTAATDIMLAHVQGLEELLVKDQAVDVERLQDFFFASKSHGQRIHSGLTEVLMAQEYQDLTGQVIKRTIEIVGELERGLVTLITHEWIDKASAQMPPIDPLAPQGPALRAQANVVSVQSDVDDLLASLGV